MSADCPQTPPTEAPTAGSASAEPTYRIDHQFFDKKDKLTPKGRYFTFQLGQHKLTVQTGAFAKQLKIGSAFLRACLHIETEHREARFLGVIESTQVRRATATMGDLQSLVGSVQLHRCLDCSETYMLDPSVPKRYICWACVRLRKVRLAGSLLVAESGHLTRRSDAIEQAHLQGMTHVVIRRKRLKLSLERFASVPPSLREHLCSLEVTRFAVDRPLTEDLDALFSVYKGPLHPPEQAVILTLQEYRNQTDLRQAMFEDLMHQGKGLRERAGESLIKELKHLKRARRSVGPQRQPFSTR
jgi:hypothetical protein